MLFSIVTLSINFNSQINFDTNKKQEEPQLKPRVCISLFLAKTRGISNAMKPMSIDKGFLPMSLK